MKKIYIYKIDTPRYMKETTIYIKINLYALEVQKHFQHLQKKMEIETENRWLSSHIQCESYKWVSDSAYFFQEFTTKLSVIFNCYSSSNINYYLSQNRKIQIIGDIRIAWLFLQTTFNLLTQWFIGKLQSVLLEIDIRRRSIMSSIEREKR